MKAKRNSRKLFLNRVTMVNLDTVHMTNAHGGRPKDRPIIDNYFETEIYCAHIMPVVINEPGPPTID